MSVELRLELSTGCGRKLLLLLVELTTLLLTTVLVDPAVVPSPLLVILEQLDAELVAKQLWIKIKKNVYSHIN